MVCARADDSSKFKAVNSRDRNFTPAKVDKRQQQIEESIQRYLDALELVPKPMTSGAKAGAADRREWA